jgi:hypothetical protein
MAIWPNSSGNPNGLKRFEFVEKMTLIEGISIYSKRGETVMRSNDLSWW